MVIDPQLLDSPSKVRGYSFPLTLHDAVARVARQRGENASLLVRRAVLRELDLLAREEAATKAALEGGAPTESA